MIQDKKLDDMTENELKAAIELMTDSELEVTMWIAKDNKIAKACHDELVRRIKAKEESK